MAFSAPATAPLKPSMPSADAMPTPQDAGTEVQLNHSCIWPKARAPAQCSETPRGCTGRPKGYRPVSITYSTTPTDQTSSGPRPCSARCGRPRRSRTPAPLAPRTSACRHATLPTSCTGPGQAANKRQGDIVVDQRERAYAGACPQTRSRRGITLEHPKSQILTRL